MHAAHVTLRRFLIGFAVPALAAAMLAACGGGGSGGPVPSSSSSGSSGPTASDSSASGSSASDSGASDSGAVASGQVAACKAALQAAFNTPVPVPTGTSAVVSMSPGVVNAAACKGLSDQEMNKIFMQIVTGGPPSSFPTP